MTSGTTIPFNDLTRMQPNLRSEIEAAISRVVQSGWFILGPEHNRLEEELAQYLGVKHVLNVGNGTEALELALFAVGVRRGSTVLTVANAGAYTTTAALLIGAEPVYVDVDQDTHLISPDLLTEALNTLEEKPAAIVVTHLYGAVAPMPEIMAIARRHNIPVIEDCAQSFGALLDGKQSGSFGDIATTSFYPTKNFGALGDGGAVYTNDSDLAEKVRVMRQYGWDSKYHIGHEHGMNSRFDEMQAAILRVKLPYLDAVNKRRKEIHSVYEDVSFGWGQLLNRSNESFNAHLAVVTSDDRTAIRAKLASQGISTDVHYPVPDHEQNFPAFKPRSLPLPVTERLANQVFSLPCFPELTDEEVHRIASALESI